MRIASIALAATLTTLTACGGSGGEDTAGPTTTTPATTAATTAAATPGEAKPSLTGPVDDRGSEDLGAKTSLVLDLGDFFFDPTFVTAKGGSTLTVALTNSGKAPHTFTVLDPAVDVTVDVGGTGSATVELPASGTVTFYCRFHRAQGMQGAFTLT